MREARSSPPAHRGARVIRTDALRFVLILREPPDGKEGKQEREEDPDINCQQSSGWYPPIHRSKKSPGTSEAFKELTCRGIQGSRCPEPSDITPKHKSGKARNQMQRAGLGPMVRPETS